MSEAFRRIARRLRWIGLTILPLAIGLSCRSGDLSQEGAPGLMRLWYTQTSPANPGRSLPIVAGNSVITGVVHGIAALDSESGGLRWTARIWPEEVVSNARNVAVGDGVACIADQFAVGCVDVTSGRVLWTRRTDTTSASGRDAFAYNASDGESIVDGPMWFYGARDHRVHAVESRTGIVRWETDITPDAKFMTRVFGVTVGAGVVYAATVRFESIGGVPSFGDLVALDEHTGSVIWHYTTPPTHGGLQGQPILTDHIIVVNDSYYHALLGIDRSTGKELWRTEKSDSGYVNSEATPVVIGDTVFAASTDTYVYAVNLQTGRVIWRAPGSGGALGYVAACPRALIELEYGSSRPFLIDRTTHTLSATDVTEGGHNIISEIRVDGDRAYASGAYGLYAFQCK